MEMTKEPTCPHGQTVTDNLLFDSVPFSVWCKDCRITEVKDCESRYPREDVLDIVLDTGYANSVLYNVLKERGY